MENEYSWKILSKLDDYSNRNVPRVFKKNVYILVVIRTFFVYIVLYGGNILWMQILYLYKTTIHAYYVSNKLFTLFNKTDPNHSRINIMTEI